MTQMASTAAKERSEPLLQMRNLSVHYGPLQALDDVDMVIWPGELVALAGENGAGKTTLIRCIAGDLVPESGEISLDNHPVGRSPITTTQQGVSVVWQDLALCDNLSIAENLLLGWEKKRKHFFLSDISTSMEATSILQGFGIHLGDITRPVRFLSGGQRQLLAVARAIRDKPRLLILDEPTASLGVSESVRVEELITELHRQGVTILLASHDIEQMFRLADRIVVLRRGQIVAEADPKVAYVDDVIALASGQEIDSSARHQLIRLHGLVDSLTSVPPSSGLSLILSALGAALHTDQLSIHLLKEDKATLHCSVSQGLPHSLLSAWSLLPTGHLGGPIGIAAATGRTVVNETVKMSVDWLPFQSLAEEAGIQSSWAIPIYGSSGSGVIGVIAAYFSYPCTPQRDQLELLTLYAGYAASAIEHDRLLSEITVRNRVLETVREMLETLAGPTPTTEGLLIASRILLRGLKADSVSLWELSDEGYLRRFLVDELGIHYDGDADALSEELLEDLLIHESGKAVALQDTVNKQYVAVIFAAPATAAVTVLANFSSDRLSDSSMQVKELACPPRSSTSKSSPVPTPEQSASTVRLVLLARWTDSAVPEEALALIEDAAHSLQLALEREKAELAQQEAVALRRSQELQMNFLSRLSHELRTPLTAIRGYASSLLQPDVTWDSASEERFLNRIASESARLGRLVNDLLDFSSIESNTLRLHQDWCDLSLVLEAAAACLPSQGSEPIEIECEQELPVIWADHDRLEQVFVNLFHNAVSHNPPGTRVRAKAFRKDADVVVVDVFDDGAEDSPEMISFDPDKWGPSRTSNRGLGLSIAQGIIAAHGGRMELKNLDEGHCFSVLLPVEKPS
ncbi:MAG: ATP-binding cassette domain-containing protein [Actinobacteria bacterium]|nr:ATP-binding cassette domain-containing protein [Actinomycetota bacterium]